MAETEALEDYTSKLPQHIIHHILSFHQFPPSQAARTSVLSKAWLSAWRTRPNLVFTYLYRHTDNQEIEIRRRRNSINSINTTLLRYHENKPGIDSLVLCLPSDWFDHVNGWLQIAIENNVKSVNIGLSGDSPILPSTIFEAKSLVKLALSNLQLKPQVIQTIRSHSLLILELSMVHVDEVMFQRIISSCPLIEELNIDCCEGLENIKVTKLQKLKKVRIKKESGCVEIDAPSLEYFFYCRGDYFGYSSDDEGPPPSRHSQLRMPTCQNLKKLELVDVGITDEFFLDNADKFPHLEDLDIQGCCDLQRIKFSSNSIRRINLEWNSGLREAEIDVPNLDWFGYQGSFIPLPFFTAPSCPRISEIELCCLIEETWWFPSLKNLLTKLSQCEISLEIDVCKDVAGSIADEMMRNSARLPPPQLQKLSLCTYMEAKLDDANLFLDVIFWTCRPKTILQKRFKRPALARVCFEKAIFEKLVGNQKHTILQRTNLWQSYIKDAKIVIVKDGKEVQLPFPLDWDSFLHTLSANHCWEFFYELEWETSDDNGWEQKVSRKNRRKLKEGKV